MTFDLRAVAIALLLCALKIPAHAGEIRIEGGEPRTSITLRIQDMTAHGVLRDLGSLYGFEIAGSADIDQGEVITATMTGSLPAILARLLRNRDHIIVRSADNASGVEKVVLPAKGGKAPSPSAPTESRSFPAIDPARSSSHD